MTYPKPIVRTVTGNGSFVVGRGSTANVRLHDASVSRNHARLTFGGPHVQVEDLDSANGTRIVTVGSDHGRTAVHDLALKPNHPMQVPENATLHFGSVVVLVRRALRPQEMQPTGLVARSTAMQEMLQLLDRLASSPLHVALVGPPGAGRDTLARTLHERSPRARGPFIASQASSRAPAVMERELFGVERGPVPPSAGLLEAAHGGTLMLDAAEALSPTLQNELLRAMTGRSVTRVGARKSTPIDVRLVIGTRSEDLFTKALCQLGGVTLAVPSLADREADIELLAESFVARAAHALDRPPPPISHDAKVVLLQYGYPQNLRELADIVTRAVPLAGSGPILPAHLLIMSETGPREIVDESEVTMLRSLPILPE